MNNKNHFYKLSLRFLCLFFLGVALVFSASPGEKKRLDPKEMVQLKGSPDNAGGPILPKQPAASPAALPIPAFPPYQPVPMTYQPGTSGLVVYSNTNGVAMINPRTHAISPMLLNEFDYTLNPETGFPIGAQLGSEGGGRFDLAMTSDGREALISNFGDSKVFFINLRSGTPVVDGMAKIDFFAEDIVIHPANEWALVTDGGFTARIAVLHIPTRTWIPDGFDAFDPPNPISYTLPKVYITIEDPTDSRYPGYYQGRYANAIDITPDGRTVIVADYFNSAIHVLLFDPATGVLSFQQTEWLWKYGTDKTAAFPIMLRPVNIAISPDGRTVIGVNAQRSTSNPHDPDPDAIFEGCSLPVLTIDRPGHIVRHPDVIMPYEVDGGQTLVFSSDGRKAYLHTIYKDEEPEYDPEDPDSYNNSYWEYSEIQLLTINGPGQVRRTGSLRLPTKRGTSQLFGVDTMAITRDGGFLYVTNPTLSGASPVIDVVNLRTFSHVKSIGTPTAYPDPKRDYPDPPDPPDPDLPSDYIEIVIPEGIAFPKTPPNRRPLAVITVDKPEILVDAGQIATFDGSGSRDPEEKPLTYSWSLVAAPAGASATLAADGATAVLNPDPNREGTYQVGLVVNDGVLNSDMAMASVSARFAPVLPPAGAVLQRLENNFVFYKEYVNRLAWTANPENLSTITAIKIYRKQKGAADSSYSPLTSLAASITGYDDKALAAEQLFTYRITSVNSRGAESDPVVVGN